jgi:capsular polysaccharide export protein
VAAALILYPRYFDPESGLPCPPRLVLDRINRMTAYCRPSRLARWPEEPLLPGAGWRP